MDKIIEMRRLVSLGELMKQFASQIKELLLAIVALMRAAREKLSSFNVNQLAENVDDVVGDKIGSIVGDEIGDLVGDKVSDTVSKVSGRFNKLFK